MDRLVCDAYRSIIRSQNCANLLPFVRTYRFLGVRKPLNWAFKLSSESPLDYNRNRNPHKIDALRAVRRFHGGMRPISYFFKQFLSTVNLPHGAPCQALFSDTGWRWLSGSHPMLASKQNKPDGGWHDPNKAGSNGGDGDEEENFRKLLRMTISAVVTAFIFYVVLSVVLSQPDGGGNMMFVSWNEFLYGMLAKGEVESIKVSPESEVAIIRLHPGAIIGDKVARMVYLMKIPEPEKFEDKLRAAERDLGIDPKSYISISYHYPGSFSKVVLFGTIALIVLLPFLFLKNQLPKVNISDMFSQMRRAQVTRMDAQRGSGASDVKFADVAGLKEAKVEIMEFVDYLKSPQRYKDIGAKIPRGALLLGPPGCGKTLLARAVSNEANVPFMAMAGSEFVEIIGGLGASRVRDLFKQAKEQSPSIIYIDEIDAIGKKRASGAGDSSEEDHTLNQLLVEMDGIGTQDDVIMLAATNRVDLLDKALLRPGRFDRHINIDLPTLIERQETFDIYLKKLKLDEDTPKYSHWLAQLTPGMSGADINNLCNEAAIHAATQQKASVGKVDLEYAMERVVAGMAKRSSMLSKEEKRIVAFHECGHALVGWLLPTTDALLRISIVPRTSRALGYTQYNPSDLKLHSQQQLFERMCMALGGRVAEAIVFNHVTTGAHDDLTRVTKLAYDQIRSFGMNERVGCVSFGVDDSSEFLVKPYSKALAAVIDEESRSLVARAYKRTEQIISDNIDLLHKMAGALLERETLTYDDVKNLIGAPPHGPKGTVVAQEWEAVDRNNNAEGDDESASREGDASDEETDESQENRQ